MEQTAKTCPYKDSCGGCSMQGIEYAEQLKKKQKLMQKLLGNFSKIRPILGMEEPFYYRNKVHHVFASDRRLGLVGGIYRKGTHKIVPVKHCMIEDETSQEIISTIEELAKTFKIRGYNEDRGHGMLRHVLVRRGFSTGEILVVIVTGTSTFPSKKAFTQALLERHPMITGIVWNINDQKTTFVLGKRSEVLYGNGSIRDILCGKSFRISPQSFYQVNPVQTEVLYRTAIEYAELTGKETVIDAYCGIGTIGLTAADRARKVIGIELNPDAVKDAKNNARENSIENACFYQGDAGKFMTRMAHNGEHADVVFLDPPRSGSTEEFIQSVKILGPKRVVYISCGPESLKRDLEIFRKQGFQVKKIQPVDLFPFTDHCENVVCLINQNV